MRHQCWERYFKKVISYSYSLLVPKSYWVSHWITKKKIQHTQRIQIYFSEQLSLVLYVLNGWTPHSRPWYTSNRIFLQRLWNICWILQKKTTFHWFAPDSPFLLLHRISLVCACACARARVRVRVRVCVWKHWLRSATMEHDSALANHNRLSRC